VKLESYLQSPGIFMAFRPALLRARPTVAIRSRLRAGPAQRNRERDEP
jgi:hypothetical protein